MVKPRLIEESPMSLAEAREELEKIRERDGELNFRAGKCEEYLNEFVSIKPKDAAELKKKLQALGISRLKEENIVKIIDLLPTTVDEVKVVFQGSVASISKKDMEQISGVVKAVV
jgi:DNA-directed RNA polymerase subunit F